MSQIRVSRNEAGGTFTSKQCFLKPILRYFTEKMDLKNVKRRCLLQLSACWTCDWYMYIPCRFLTWEKRIEISVDTWETKWKHFGEEKTRILSKGPMLIKNSFVMELGILKCNYIHFSCLESTYSFEKSNSCFPIFAGSSLETVKSTFAIIETSILSVYFFSVLELS